MGFRMGGKGSGGEEGYYLSCPMGCWWVRSIAKNRCRLVLRTNHCTIETASVIRNNIHRCATALLVYRSGDKRSLSVCERSYTLMLAVKEMLKSIHSFPSSPAILLTCAMLT